ncbi:MAG TPA: hypothetical protein VE503_07320, partial [Ornithinibacter sp.]|nr:hypothetical protein [Ornithinibacter sp.]
PPPPDGGGGPAGGGFPPDPYAGGPAPAAPAARPAAAAPAPVEPAEEENGRTEGPERVRQGQGGERGPGVVPESWYRSSNADGPSRLGDTGEIPVVHVPRDDEDDDPRLYPPRNWVD